MTALMPSTESTTAGPTITFRVPDPLRLRQLVRDLPHFAQADTEADVMVLYLPAHASLPTEALSFDGALLVLSDDPTVSADTSLQGVLPSSARGGQISSAIMALAEGLRVRLHGGPATSDRPGFAPRELEVLALVGEGMSNKTIARKLGISSHTVKYHLEAVFTKLGVRSRAEAVTRGLRRGLLVV
jgi:two-component system nitrate/nitrite response regulator NarL